MAAEAVAQATPAWGAQRALRRLDLFYLTTLAVAVTLHALRVAPGLCQATFGAGSSAADTQHTDGAATSSPYDAYLGNRSSCYSQGVLHRAGCGCLLLPQLHEHVCEGSRSLTPWHAPSKLACAMLVAGNCLIKVLVMPLAQPWVLQNPPLGLAPILVLLYLLGILAPMPVLRRTRRSSRQHTAEQQGGYNPSGGTSSCGRRQADSAHQQDQQRAQWNGPKDPRPVPEGSTAAAGSSAAGQGRRWSISRMWSALCQASGWHVTWCHPDWYWKTPRVRVTAALLLRLTISSARGLSVGPFKPPPHLLPYHPGSVWPHMHFLWAAWQACCVLLPLRLQFLTTTWEWLVTVYIWHQMDGPLFAPGARLAHALIAVISLVLVVGVACGASWWFDRTWATDAPSSATAASSRQGAARTMLQAAGGCAVDGGSSRRSSADSGDCKLWGGLKGSGKHTAYGGTTDSSSALGGCMQGGACRASSSSSSAGGGGSGSSQGSRRSSISSSCASRRSSLSRVSASSVDALTPGMPLSLGEGPAAPSSSHGWPNSSHVMPVHLQEQLLALFGREEGLDMIQRVQPQPVAWATYTPTTETLPVSIKVRSDHSQVARMGPQLQACLQRCAQREQSWQEAAVAAAAPAEASSPGGAARVAPRVLARSVCFAGCVQLLGSVYYTAGAAERRQRAAVAAQRVTRVLCDLLTSEGAVDLWDSSSSPAGSTHQGVGCMPQQQQRRRRQQQQQQPLREAGKEGGTVSGSTPCVEVVVNGVSSWLDAAGQPMVTSSPAPKPWAAGTQLLYLEPPVLAAAEPGAHGGQGGTDAPLSHQQQDQQHQQELLLVLDLPHQQFGPGGPAAAGAQPGAAPVAGSDAPLCRLLVFTEQRVLVDQVAVLQQRIRVAVPPLPAGYYYVALLPSEDGPAGYSTCASSSTFTAAASSSSSSSSGRSGHSPSMSAAPMVLQPLVVLPYRAACEVQHLWEAVARAVGSPDIPGAPALTAPAGCSPWVAAQLQEAAEVRAMQHKVVVWDSVVSGLLQDITALLAVTTPAPNTTTTTSSSRSSSSSTRQQAVPAGRLLPEGRREDHHHHQQQQQQQQGDEAEGEPAPAGNPGRRSLSSDRVAEVVQLQGTAMPVLSFLSQHHMWNAAQWLCGEVGAHIAAATHSAAAAGRDIARSSHTSTSGSGGAAFPCGGGSSSNNVQTYGVGQGHGEGGRGSTDGPPALQATPTGNLGGVDGMGSSLGPFTPTGGEGPRRSTSSRWGSPSASPRGSQQAAAAAAAAGTAATTAGASDGGAGCASLLARCQRSSSSTSSSSQRDSLDTPTSPSCGKQRRPAGALQAQQQQQQQQQQRQRLAAAAAREVAAAEQDPGWRRHSRQLLRGFQDPLLEESYLLAISSSCYWADSLAICIPLVPVAMSGVMTGLLRRVAWMGLAAGLEGCGGKLAAFAAFAVVPLLLLALVGPGMALGRRHELMHAVCEVMMASVAGCQLLGWVELQPEWNHMLALPLGNSCFLGTLLTARPLLRQVRLHVQLPWIVLEGLMLFLLAHRLHGSAALPLLVLRSGFISSVAVGVLAAVEARRRASFVHTLSRTAL